MQTRERWGLITAACVAAALSGPAWAVCPPDCATPGGGDPTTDCLSEIVGAASAADGTTRLIRCQDGAPCDQDGQADGACVFHLRVCLNQDDPNLPQCSAKGVSNFSIRSAARASGLSALQSSARALLPTNTGVCTDAQSIRVPLTGTPARPQTGRLSVRSLASGAGGRDFDDVTLVCVPPPRPLGLRHFSIQTNHSPLKVVLGTGSSLNPGQFSGYLDLQAGIPDPVTGVATIDIVGASEYIVADLTSLASTILCLKPTGLPVMSAGLIACKGQRDFSFFASVNHVIGTVGVDGFTAEDCAAADGTLEDGSEDLPYAGVCSGPFEFGSLGAGDSGRGAVAIAPLPDDGLNGLPVDLAFLDHGLCNSDRTLSCKTNADCTMGGGCKFDCHDAPPGQMVSLPFFSAPEHAEVQNRNAVLGDTLAFDSTDFRDTRPENFSCANWTVENGPGRLIFTIPQLNVQVVGTTDIISVFVLSDR